MKKHISIFKVAPGECWKEWQKFFYEKHEEKNIRNVLRSYYFANTSITPYDGFFVIEYEVEEPVIIKIGKKLNKDIKITGSAYNCPFCDETVFYTNDKLKPAISFHRTKYCSQCGLRIKFKEYKK